MEDRDDPMWEGLGSIDAFISSPTHSQPSSPSSTWPWTRPPLPSVLQVRLDGEPAEDAPDLDLLLPSLPVASGRVEKVINHAPPPLLLPPSSIKKERIKAEPKHEPMPVLNKHPSPSVVKVSPAQVQPPQPPPLQAHPRCIPKMEPQVRKQPVHTHDDAAVSSASMPTAALTVSTAASLPVVSTNDVYGVVDKVESSSEVDHSVSLKEKREREARQFPREVLGNLDGTTSAEVRKMNATERELVLYKRKLRNRESARRSRQKRQATLAELQEEIDDLMQVTGRMVEVGISLHEENVRLRDRLAGANKEIVRMRGMYSEEDADAGASSAALKMKLGG